MPVGERQSQELSGQRKCQYLTPTIWQRFVKTYNAPREAKNTICQFPFREDGLSRTKAVIHCELLKFSKLFGIKSFPAEKCRKQSAWHRTNLISPADLQGQNAATRGWIIIRLQLPLI